MRFRAAEQLWSGEISVLAFEPNGLGRIGAVVLPVTFTLKAHEEGHPIDEPTFKFGRDTADSLMNALWDAGLRPHGFTSSGELKRLEDHLADMRKLVFK